MLKKVVVVRVNRYDYFGGQKDENHKFESMIEAWNFFKEQRGYDFRYDDAFHITDEPWTYWTNEIQKTGKHPWKPRTIKTQKNVCLDEACPFDSDIFVTPLFDVDDEDIII